MSEYKTIKSLKEQVTTLGAGEGHMEIQGVGKNPKYTAVISFYDDQMPSHKVLDKLYEWAETHGKNEVIEMIQYLSEFEEEVE